MSVRSVATGRLATLTATLFVAYLGSLAACLSPAEQCAGNIEVTCGPDGCQCAIGAFEGESCRDEPNSTDPDACENLCCGAGQGIDGPPSILKGTK